eukprot:984131-Rhodomonas_salina.1
MRVRASRQQAAHVRRCSSAHASQKVKHSRLDCAKSSLEGGREDTSASKPRARAAPQSLAHSTHALACEASTAPVDASSALQVVVGRVLERRLTRAQHSQLTSR